jgi:hypothetical protein
MNAGVANIALPTAIDADQKVAGELAVYGSELSQGKTATIEVREGDRLVYTGEVRLPAPGLVTNVSLDLPVASARGTVRYEARVRVPDDAFTEDDARASYVDVDPEQGLLVALALSPDWELRFMLPILEQVTGLTTRGYVRVGPDRYLATGGTSTAGPVSSEDIRRRVEGAEMLVLQGLGADDPDWLRGAAESGRRVIVLPDDPSGAAAAGVAVGPTQTGEWYASPEIPSSPIAGDLTGAELQGLPPLTSLLPVARQNQGEAPLRLQLRGSGGGEPALLLVSSENGRRAVMLANGFWRWGFREGAAREAYRRLWAGVAGWLFADESVSGGPFVRPLARVVPRAQPVQWRAPALAGEEVRLVLARGDSTVVDSVLIVPSTGALLTAPMPPGTYQYSATAPTREGEVAEGAFDVEAHTYELRHQPQAALTSVTPVEREGSEQEPGRRPLRTHPLPYLVLIGFLCGEWIGRRRKGLR